MAYALGLHYFTPLGRSKSLWSQRVKNRARNVAFRIRGYYFVCLRCFLKSVTVTNDGRERACRRPDVCGRSHHEADWIATIPKCIKLIQGAKVLFLDMGSVANL